MRVIGQDLTNLKSALTTFPLQFEAQIIYEEGNSTITLDNDNLFRVLYYYDGDILKSNMQCLEFDCEYNIEKDTQVNFQIKVLYNNEYITLDYGIFKVISVDKQKDTNTYLIKCADALIESMKDYESMNITYPITLGNYLDAICTHLGLTLASNVFPNSTREIPSELYLNIGYKFRDVLDEISQCAGSSICINSNNEVEVKTINNTNDTIDENYINQNNVTFGELYGPINSIVLSRSAESDNVFISDDESIELNGLCELKIVDNQIMNDNNRSDYLQEIANNLFGISYYEHNYSSSSQGILYYNFLDKYNVSIGNETYSCLMLNDDVVLDDGVSETLAGSIPNQAKTDYSQATTTDKQLSRAMLIVDKVKGEIDAKVDKDGIIAELNLAIEDGQGVINAKGNTFILDADNASIDAEGNAEFNDAKLRGGDLILEDDGSDAHASITILQNNIENVVYLGYGMDLTNKTIYIDCRGMSFNTLNALDGEEIIIFKTDNNVSTSLIFKCYEYNGAKSVRLDLGSQTYFFYKLYDAFVSDIWTITIPSGLGTINDLTNTELYRKFTLESTITSRETKYSGLGLNGDMFPTMAYGVDDDARCFRIIIGEIDPTTEDYEKYDLNKDGVIDEKDYDMLGNITYTPINLEQPAKFKIDYNDLLRTLSIKMPNGDDRVYVGLLGSYFYNCILGEADIETALRVHGNIELDADSDIYLNYDSLKDKLQPQIMTLALTSNVNIRVGTAWNHYIVNLNTTSNKEGNELSLSSNGVKIGSGISKVKVSANVCMRGIANSSLYASIRRGTTEVSNSYILIPNTNSYVSAIMTEKIIAVSEGDIITLNVGAGTTGTIQVSATTLTYLTVEKVI